MYELRRHRRNGRRASRAWTHGVYIRFVDRELWTIVQQEAKKNDVSIGRFVNHGLWTLLTGKVPKASR